MSKEIDIKNNDEITSADVPTTSEVISMKFKDAQIPGFEAEFDPEEADAAGAFEENALSEEDAAQSSIDMSDEELAFIDEPTLDLPPFITRSNLKD